MVKGWEEEAGKKRDVVFEFVGGLFCAIFDPVKIASSIQTSVTR
jgi:hypothetical protein